jgi:uncharacterized protein (TIGR02646 family)
MTKQVQPARTNSPLVTRSEVEPRDDYRQYKETLRHDFFFSCAYCTITEHEAETINFNIDHYEPQSLNPELTNSYSNLMYSCRYCNNYKGEDHFKVEDKCLEYKTGIGDFSIMYLDLNRPCLIRLRDIRRRLTECEEYVRAGVFGLRNYRIDALPPKLRTRALSVGRQAEKIQEQLEEDIDAILRRHAASAMAAPDAESEARAEARSSCLAQLKRTYPGLWRGRTKH